MATKTAETPADENSGFFDRRYYRGLLTIPKCFEVICSLIAYICVELESCVGMATTNGYFKFVSIAAFVSTLVLWVLLLLKVPQRILRCDCVRWPFPEFCFYCGVILMYFFADLFLAIQGCGGGHDAGTAFGFFALFAYVVDAGWVGLQWWRNKRAAGQPSSPSQQEAAVEGRY